MAVWLSFGKKVNEYQSRITNVAPPICATAKNEGRKPARNTADAQPVKPPRASKVSTYSGRLNFCRFKASWTPCTNNDKGNLSRPTKLTIECGDVNQVTGRAPITGNNWTHPGGFGLGAQSDYRGQDLTSTGQTYSSAAKYGFYVLLLNDFQQ